MEFDKVVVERKHGGATLTYTYRGRTVKNMWCNDVMLEDVLHDYKKNGDLKGHKVRIKVVERRWNYGLGKINL